MANCLLDGKGRALEQTTKRLYEEVAFLRITKDRIARHLLE
jgi:hypothetical protein